MQTLANYLLYGLAMSMLRGLVCLPLGVAYWLGAHLGDVLYLVLTRRRRIVFENLTIAFGTDTCQEGARRTASFSVVTRHPACCVSTVAIMVRQSSCV